MHADLPRLDFCQSIRLGKIGFGGGKIEDLFFPPLVYFHKYTNGLARGMRSLGWNSESLFLLPSLFPPRIYYTAFSFFSLLLFFTTSLALAILSAAGRLGGKVEIIAFINHEPFIKLSF